MVNSLIAANSAVAPTSDLMLNTNTVSTGDRIVSTTNTTVTVFAGRSPGLVVLGLTVLGVPVGAAIPLHLIAVCP